MGQRRSAREYFGTIKADIDQKMAWEKAAKAGDPEATLKLGELQTHYRQPKQARAAFEQVISSGHPDYAPVAANSLGNFLRQAGDPDGARAAYQQAIDSGHPQWAPIAALNLGMMLPEAGDKAGARDAFEHVVRLGHAEHAPLAAFNLGVLRRRPATWPAPGRPARRRPTPATPSGRRGLRPFSATSCARTRTSPARGPRTSTRSARVCCPGPRSRCTSWLWSASGSGTSTAPWPRCGRRPTPATPPWPG